MKKAANAASNDVFLMVDVPSESLREAMSFQYNGRMT
jgi:hypothetical protein